MEKRVREISQAVQEEIKKLYDTLEPANLTSRQFREAVISYARNPETALHGHFEWDAERAQEAYLDLQAADLIRRVKFKIIVDDRPTTIIARYFVNVPDDTGQRVYRPESVVRQDPNLRSRALQEMEADWTRLRNKWQLYSEFWDLVEEEVRKQEENTA